MAHGLETRVPFLDNDLVDFALKVPPRYKLRDLDACASRGRRRSRQDLAVSAAADG